MSYPVYMILTLTFPVFRTKVNELKLCSVLALFFKVCWCFSWPNSWQILLNIQIRLASPLTQMGARKECCF